MIEPYTPEIEIDGRKYFPAPYSLHPLPNDLRNGLIPVGLFALLSVVSTLTLICFIAWRFATWRLHYRTFLGYNQYVVLVLNLLLADLQQSSGFLISFHWYRVDEIMAPSSACFAQGWLIHSGDVGSGLFVLAVAVHTFYTAVYGRRISNKMFASGIVGLWTFAYFLTAVGVGMHGDKYFVKAGAWCWVSSAYEADRLAFHYIWIFVIEFGTILIYLVTFYQLRRKTRQLFAGPLGDNTTRNTATIEAVNRITKLMTLYPCVYVLLTLPLSAGRMWSMAHHGQAYSNVFACLAGSLITSCGWVDSLLYTLTRKRLLKDTMPGHSSSGRRTGPSGSDNWEATELGSKGITHTRTVTVEGGQMMDTYQHAHQGSISMPGARTQNSSWEARPPSPNGSIDPILSGKGSAGRTKTEVTVGLEQIMAEDSEEDDISALPPYVARTPRKHQDGKM
ncbi:hypothetical protein LTR78_005763 [Recurvomyces mirabilis]|uniref:G protein-coupled receptor GPR1/2/3 C-terminal domain-containing protein n=1 Tax=Recurvomyces mirabilis TaxID=574656 RepID=A0AAE0WM80_9PEZI|nr:hypothetical protein LTR78_005763 [Recurvomyces mirabilis]KAK5154142.1 hypothetical protein LTS14_006827 [Recurvomyces mirabilis]